MKNKER